MTLLKNAIDSIQVGLEDFRSDDPRRTVSAARNIVAGILLLYKERLRQLSPINSNEALLKQKIQPVQNPRGEIIFKGNGRKTVDVQSIQERFRSLSIETDWQRFNEINQLRNEVEHYYTLESPEAIREIVAKSFLLIRNFLLTELQLDPAETLGIKYWQQLLQENEVYRTEKNNCAETLTFIDWRYNSVSNSLRHLRCGRCYSALVEATCPEDVYPRITLRCTSCGHSFSFEEVVEICIDEAFSGFVYKALKHGEEPPHTKCPDCHKSTFIYEEGRCVACHYQMEYWNCSSCEEPLGIDEQYNDGFCGYCLHKWSKISAEWQ